MTTLPILVAGGGIGGLAAAVGLAAKGLKSIVLEKAPALGEIGAGIQLGPNAFHSFDYLGVGDAARAIAVYVDRLRLMDAMSGEEITSIPLDAPFRKRFGNPYAVIHRGDLHAIFLNACRASALIDLRTAARSIPTHRMAARSRCASPRARPSKGRRSSAPTACGPTSESSSSATERRGCRDTRLIVR